MGDTSRVFFSRQKIQKSLVDLCPISAKWLLKLETQMMFPGLGGHG
jgi:hypothetical protein